MARSYSRNSGRISDESETGRSGETFAHDGLQRLLVGRDWRRSASARWSAPRSPSYTDRRSRPWPGRDRGARSPRLWHRSARQRRGCRPGRPKRARACPSRSSRTAGPASRIWPGATCIRNPCVVSRPTRAPLPSSTALVATVVPCRITSICDRVDRGLLADQPDAIQDTDRLIFRRRRRLALHGAPACIVVQEQVGERAADIDAQSHAQGP